MNEKKGSARKSPQPKNRSLEGAENQSYNSNIEGEQLFRALVENSPDYIARYDRNFRRIYVNPAIQKLFKVPKTEVLGASPSDQSPVHTPKVYTDNLNQVFKTGKECSAEIPFQTETGAVHWGHIRFVPEFDQEGRVATVLAIGRDIHDIKENEQKFRMLADNFPDLVARFDREDRFTYVNQALVQMLNRPRNEIVGKTLTQLKGLNDPKRAKSLIKTVGDIFKTGDSKEFTTNWTTPIGGRYFEIRHIPEKDAAGNIVSVLSIARDITDQKRNELMNTARLHLLQFAESHNLEELLEETLNEAEKLTGSSIGFFHLVGEDQESLTLQSWSTQTKSKFCRVKGQKFHNGFENAGVWLDGVRERKAIIHNDYQSLPHRKGMPKGHGDLIRELVVPVVKGKTVKAVLGVGNKLTDYVPRDIKDIQLLADMAWEIAERKLVEKKLLRSEQRLRLHSEQSPLGFLEWDENFCALEWNAACEQIFGFTRKEAIGKHAKDLILPPQVQDMVDEIYHELMARRGGQHSINENVTKDGRIIICEWFNTTLVDKDDKAIGVASICRDITDVKKAEENLKQLNRELRAISDCNQTLMRAEDEQTLLKEICEIICSEAGYRLAWVGYAENNEEKTIRPMAWAGYDSDYVANAKLSWDENQERGQGPAGEVIRQGKPIHVQDFSTDYRMEPWRKAALARGYRSGIALPLKDEQGQVFGTLLIYSVDVNAMTPEEIRLMEELAGDLAYGITALRMREKKKIAEEALRDREAFLTSIIENIPDMVFIKDARELKFVRVNKAAEKLLGLKRSEMIGKSDFDFFTKDQAEFFTGNDRKVLSQGIKLDIAEEPINTSEGERILHTKKIPIPDENGNPAFLLGISEDITERKELGQQLITREQEFRTLVENIPDFIVRYNKDLKRTFVNSAWEKASGLSAKDVVDVPIDQIPGVKKPVIAKYEEKLRSVLKTGKAQTLEFEWANAFGEILNLEYKIVPEFDQSGAIKGVLAVGHDLTERKRIQDALSASETELRTLFNAMSDVILVMDANGRYLEIPETNPALLYRPSQELIGTTLHEVFPKDQADFFLNQITQALETNDTVNFEYSLSIENREIWFNASASPLTDNKILLVARDITHHKEAETERAARLQFFRSMDKINQAIHGVEEIEEMMTDLLDTMLAIFECDRAWLINPCDPDVPVWQVAMERTQPEYPGIAQKGIDLSMEPEDAELYRVLRKTSGPVQFHPKSKHPLRKAMAKRFQLKSFIATALYPKIGKPWAFGLDQCSHSRVWTEHEERLFRTIAQRVGDAITSLLSIRELRTSEERYRLIAENTADMINILGLDLKFKYISPSIKNMLGYTVQEAMDRTLEDLLTPESLAKVHETLAYQLSLEGDKTAEPDRSVLLELEEYHKDGSIVPVELSASFLRDDKMNPVSILTVIRNITKRKKAQQELIESEQKFRSLADSIPDNIIRHNANMDIIYFNKNMEQATEFDFNAANDEPLSQKIQTVIPKGYVEVLEKVIQYGKEEELEVEIKTPDGETRIHNIRFVAERDRNGKIIGAIAVGRDITEIKKVQESLRKLFHAVEQSPVSIIITNTNADIEYVNPRFTTVTGYSSKEVLGRNPRFLKSGEMSEEFYENLWDSISNGKIWHGEFHNRRKDGTLYYESASISPVFDDTGTITHYIAMKEDITERKILEQQLRQAQKMEAIGQLAGGVAHDFNNMLGVILGYSELGLKKVDPSQDIHSDLMEIFKAANRSADLTRQLLTFARKQTVMLKVVNLNEMINGMLKMLRRLLTEQITLHWKPGSDLLDIKMDPGQVDQILANLCVNARDAINGVGEITIMTENQTFDEAYCALNPDLTPGEYILLSVKDNGMGMDEATRERIFEPFFTTKETGKGTGLGLATIYGIVKQNGCHIDVQSKLGEGTTFTLYLPAYTETDRAIIADKDSTKYHNLGNKTILLVEDEPSILRLTHEMLEVQGYQVLAVNSPLKALQIAREHAEIDILITDVIMPEFDGRTLARRLAELFPNLKCLFMSGYSGDFINQDESASGEIHFIQKPFKMRDLARALSELEKDTPKL